MTMVVLCRCLVVFVLILYALDVNLKYSDGTILPRQIKSYKDKISSMFRYAYENYLHYAYPYDELRPLSCDGIDTWGKFSLTLIDALDTLAILGNYSEFRRVVDIVTHNVNFDINVNVSVFETNIRVIGGLLSAHLLSKKAGIDVEPGWPCSGPLLRMAENIAMRILPAFNTNTGMPYGTVNLRHGVPPGETTITCTAGIATFIVEFGTISRLTGNPIFEEAAMKAINHVWKTRSRIGLVGNHIDVQSGKWTAADSGIGAGIDSYFEYLVKGAILLQKPELMKMFEEYKSVITKYNKHDDWYLWVGMTHGKISLPIFQSLEAFWPGLLSLVGDLDQAVKTMHNYHQVLKQYGFTPEFYNIIQGEVYNNREGYPLRPEFIESAFYLYKATKDPFFLQIGMDTVEAIEHSAKTPCGYATIKDVHSHLIEDRMESFFLAETTKYLYLLFDEDNFISKYQNSGIWGETIETSDGKCIIDAGGYVFNTEAHPIDISGVHCCSLQHKRDRQALKKLSDETEVFDSLYNSQSVRNIFRTKFHHQSNPTVTYFPEEMDELADEINNSVEVDEKPKYSNGVKEGDPTIQTTGNDAISGTADSLELSGLSPKNYDLETSRGPNEDSSSRHNAKDGKREKKTSTKNRRPIQTVTIPTKLDGYSSSTKTASSPNDVKNVDDYSSISQKHERMMTNNTAESQYDRLVCSAQPFLLRLSLMGQMFYVT